MDGRGKCSHHSVPSASRATAQTGRVMPNRIVKETLLRSRKVALLTAEEERLFLRLVLTVDDYGRFYADPAIVKSACLPTIADSIPSGRVAAWLDRLDEVGLIARYVVDGEAYLEVRKATEINKPRAKESKFAPPEKGEQISMLASDSNREHLRASANIREQMRPHSSTHSVSGTSADADAKEEQKTAPTAVSAPPEQKSLLAEPSLTKAPKAPKEAKPLPDDPDKRRDSDAWVAAYHAAVTPADRVTLSKAFWVQWSARRKADGHEKVLRSLRGILSLPIDKYPRNADPLVWVTTGYANGLNATIVPTAHAPAVPKPTYFKPEPTPKWSIENATAAARTFASAMHKKPVIKIPHGESIPEGWECPPDCEVAYLPPVEKPVRLQDMFPPSAGGEL